MGYLLWVPTVTGEENIFRPELLNVTGEEKLFILDQGIEPFHANPTLYRVAIKASLYHKVNFSTSVLYTLWHSPLDTEKALKRSKKRNINASSFVTKWSILVMLFPSKESDLIRLK